MSGVVILTDDTENSPFKTGDMVVAVSSNRQPLLEFPTADAINSLVADLGEAEFVSLQILRVPNNDQGTL